MLPTGNVFRADFTHDDKTPDSVILNLTTPIIQALDGPPQDAQLPGVFQQEPRPGVPASSLELEAALSSFRAEAEEAALGAYMYNGTFPRNEAFLASTEVDTRITDVGAPFDQYEAAVPIERAADCLRELGDAVYGPEELWRGFRTANNIRFISGEDFYISPANGGPVMWVVETSNVLLAFIFSYFYVGTASTFFLFIYFYFELWRNSLVKLIIIRISFFYSAQVYELWRLCSAQ